MPPPLTTSSAKYCAWILVVVHQSGVLFCACCDSAAALWAIEDVAINVVGTEDFVVLACGAKARLHAIAGKGPAFDEALHRAPTLAQLRKSDDRVVPLWFGGKVVGALVIRRLLEHRAPLTQADEQVLALLSHFAATAIVAWGENRDPHKTVTRLAS